MTLALAVSNINMTQTAPNFESQFLTQIAEAFVRKRKSLKYNASILKFHKIYDIVEGKKVEKIEISVESSLSRNSVRMRLYIWEDRWVWIDARKAGKMGWDWEFSKHGRLSGDCSPRQLIEAFKQFYFSSSLFDTQARTLEASTIWGEILAAGPVEVRTRPNA
jgi:hypothetical protein